MKNLYLIIHINFISFKVIPSRYNALMPTFFPIVESLVNFNFRNCLQSLLRFGLYLFNRVWGVPSHQHVFCLLWSLCTTYMVKNFLRHGQITEGLLQHPERFCNWNFILQTKFNGTSLLNKFRHCKNRKNHF